MPDPADGAILLSPRCEHGPEPVAGCIVVPCAACGHDTWVAPSSVKELGDRFESAAKVCGECGERMRQIAADTISEVRRPEGADDELIDAGNAHIAGSDRALQRQWAADSATAARPASIPAAAAKLGPGVYALDDILHIDASELLRANGWADTPENRDQVEKAARAMFSEGSIEVVE